MKRSESIKELATALANAQGDFKPAEFDGVNPHFRSKYATLTSVMNSIREPMKKNGLSVVQVVFELEKGMILETTVFHASGEWLSSDMPLYISKDDMQGLGSAITYAKRYAISAMLGIVADDDDDANAATGKPMERESLKRPVQTDLATGPQSKADNLNSRFGARRTSPVITPNGNGQDTPPWDHNG